MVPHPNEVFLAYSSLDSEIASQIAELLRRHGLPVWHSQSNLRGGDEWQDEIGAALERCDWFMILVSPNSSNSFWVKRELMFALDEERYKKRIVPVLIHACSTRQLRRLSWTLSARKFVDFTEDFEKGCRALLRIWGIGYQAAALTPTE